MKRTSLVRYPRTSQLFSDPFFGGLDRLMSDDIFTPFSLVSAPRGENPANGWIPPVDVRETADGYEFTAELPGLSKDEVGITIEDRVLNLTGERKLEGTEDRNSYQRVERTYGTFTRSFTLPNEVEQDKVEAKFKDGLLTVTIPKAEESKPRKIEIS